MGRDTVISKRQAFNSVLAVFLAIMLLFTFCFTSVSAAVYNADEIISIIEGVIAKKKTTLYGSGDISLFGDEFYKSAGNPASDWYAFSTGRLGTEDNYPEYLAFLKNYVEQRYDENGGLDARKATEWHRIALAVLALGSDPTMFGKTKDEKNINLIADGVYNRPEGSPLSAQGSNAYIWALITLDSNRYKAPEGTRNRLINEILRYRLDDGGFSLDGKNSDTDVTAMALQALAPYVNSEEPYEVNDKTLKMFEIVDKALDFLSKTQNVNGSFSSWGVENSESTAQVITALCVIGIDPINDERFVKNGYNLLDALLEYRMDDGGFAHLLKPGEKTDGIAGEQALYSLVAMYRYYGGFRSLYDFREEQSAELKESIENLRESIKELTDDSTASEITAVYNDYLSIPITERSYVSEYPHLSALMQKYSIENKSEFLADYMGERDNGNGTVTDLLDSGEIVFDTVFTQSDTAEAEGILDDLSTEYYITVIKLTDKLERATNKSDYTELLDRLYSLKSDIENLKDEIDDINAQITNKLSPYSELEKGDAELINSLIERTDKLSEHDRELITGYEVLLQAKAKLSYLERQPYIYTGIIAVLVLLVAVLMIRIKKRKDAKKIPEMEE